MSVALNPDGGQPAGMLYGWPLQMGNGFHDLQQRIEIGCFFIESIGGNTRLYAVTRECTAHSDYMDLRKPAPDHREKFEARHSRHVQV
jgi:hypothetical protein